MADNERSELRDGGAINKILITNLASMVIMFLVFTGVFYLIMDNMMTKKRLPIFKFHKRNLKKVMKAMKLKEALLLI